ncbi:sugar phosphate nucleotidyltransferase [Sphingomonas profundi]|uniref:phosphocholine cytidylyltransferase family protein n=1 Tax=Alterirhizorhabdus profundi TaxID=2681549 RepID=UPI0012E87878|nr:phosphocholine cytidylyltransferase family protein [Sphingomonas profundi]
MTTQTAITRAIILSAGQGSRLLPVTADLPKCLIPFAGKTLIEWQIAALAANGIGDIHVVTGFRTEKVEAALAGISGPTITTHFNPFYKVADNLGSCWIVREAMDRDFIILNGDTLIDPAIVAALIAGATSPITVTVDVKDAYDADDMKVHRANDGRLIAIGKRLEPQESNAESIGMLAFTGAGPALFRAQVDAMMRTPEGVLNWYLKAIHAIAQSAPATGTADSAPAVGTVSIAGMDWAEVDFPADLAIAGALTARWAAQPGQPSFSQATSASRSASGSA